MNRFCPNCGDPVEPDEVFCDKCGTKLTQDESSVGQQNNQAQTNYQGNQGQQNIYQNQNSYIPGQGNTGGFNTGQQYVNYVPQKKKSRVGFILGMIGLVIFLVLLSLIVIGIIFGDPKSPSNTNTTNPTQTSTGENTKGSNVSYAAWTANLKSYSNYAENESTIYVEYTITLTNNGPVDAEEINLYFNPAENDENATALGIKAGTVINYDGAASIAGGKTKDIKSTFHYSDVKPENASQEVLQEIADRFIKVPILIEWKENGKSYSDTLVLN